MPFACGEYGGGEIEKLGGPVAWKIICRASGTKLRGETAFEFLASCRPGRHGKHGDQMAPSTQESGV